MKRTDKYQLGYFEEGDLTNSQAETQRWETIDAQLYSAFKILGNGIIYGWNLAAGENLSVVVSSGSGHVSYVAVASQLGVIIPSLAPNERNYIYAALTSTSYWLQTLSFYSFLIPSTTDRHVYLGYVDTDSTSVTNINTEGRNDIGYISEIRDLISQHRHIGGDDNPAQIDLANDVQNELNANNMPDLDASKINEGTVDVGRIPVLDHITKLVNNGTLTHAQLDSFVSSLSQQNVSLMGDIATTNLLKMTLSLKRSISDVDEDLLNEVTMIPGVTPSGYIDSINSTASWDVVDGTIYAYPAGTPLRFYTKAFDVGYGLKSLLITYEGEIQFGASSSDSNSSDSSSSGSSASISTSASISDSSDSALPAGVRFAISAKDSVDTDDYIYVDPHKVVDISSLSSDGKIKVFVEFDGQDGELILMHGFAFMFSSLGNPEILT